MIRLGTSVSVAVAAVALGWGAPVPATAAVNHDVETLSFSTPAQGQLTSVCGYPVAMSLEGSWNIVTFTDEEGNLVKEIRNYRFTAAFSANGVTIVGRTRGPEVLEVHDDGTSTMTVMNVVSRQIRGSGTVMQHAGRMVLELDADGEPIGEPVLAGQFDDPSEVCVAFE